MMNCLYECINQGEAIKVSQTQRELTLLMMIMMSAFGFFILDSILLLCISLPVGLATTSLLGNETDRLALISFKDGITNDPLGVMNTWNESLHFCEWKGVTCSPRQHGRVITLNLQSQLLQGSLSPYIGNLSFLQIINLQNNSFHGKIPQEVGSLSKLQAFNMSNNFFVGEIPVNLSQCSKLRSLRLTYNKLVGNIPIEIGFLSNLVQLTLSANNLTGMIPPSLGNLSSLKVLSLGDNSLEGTIPESLGQLKNLKALSLGPNILSGMFPPSIYNLSSLELISAPSNYQLFGSLPIEMGLNLPNLRVFLIGQNQFHGSIPVSLFNASGLEMIDIDRNNFTGKVPIEVGKLKALQYLLLNANHFGSGEADDLNFLNSLINCTNLILLDITKNRFGGKLPSSIANLSNQLSQLSLGKNQIFGVIPTGIGNLVNLFLLGMNNNFLIGSIPRDIGKLQKLQGFSLRGNKISGKIPSSLGNISGLVQLDLSDNILEGNIDSSLGKIQFLQILDLSQNNLNGTIPKQVLGLSPSQFISINFAKNSLTGSLPFELGNMMSLEELDVSENEMSGEIPSTLGSCLSLEHLYLQGNFFQGSIPNSFNSLKGIQDLDLSRNNLSGQIPKDLEDLSFLQNLNLSFNDLEGEVPMKGVFQNGSAFSIIGNGRLCGGILQLQLPACPTKKSKKQRDSLALKMTIGVILSLVVLAFFLALYLRRRSRMKCSSTHYLGVQHETVLNGRVSYNELYKATGGFDSANLIGVGNFGSVYKGILHQNEVPVAVKVLNLMERGASKSFINECNALRNVRHRNLLKILTVCSSVDFKGNDFKAIIFEFKHNGSLANWLHPSSDEKKVSRYLNLSQRLNIAIDIASALEYLHNHCETPIVHCDMKSSNVLLDDDMTALVSDFGLAKFLIESIKNSSKIDTSSVAIKGTIGYIPPEYGMGAEVSTQGDVYSYGILLLEMFTGKKPIDDMFEDGLSLHHFAKMASIERVMEIVDPRLLLDKDHMDVLKEKVEECLTSIVRIGVSCSTESLSERMKIKDVVVELHKIKEMFLGSAGAVDRHY